MKPVPDMTTRTIRSTASGGNADSPLMRGLLMTIAFGFIIIILILPLCIVFQTAFRDGAGNWLKALTTPDTLSAIRVTLLAVAVAVPLNILFGFAAAWGITRFAFRGKRFIVSIIDLPFAVSPVIAGLLFVLLFGAGSPLGAWCANHDVKVIFALPGIILATTFVTFPFVARELIPVMQTLGPDQELAAMTLGASPWQVFRMVTFPNVKWGLFYGTTLCAARAVGEFGAVSVVSGHIRGETNTLPLHVEILYNEYHFSAAFAVSTLLVLVALITLCIRAMAEFMDTQRKSENRKKSIEACQ